MKTTVADVLSDVTQDHVEMIDRLARAIRATTAIVIPDPEWAAAALFGMSLAMIIENSGCDEQAVHDMVTQWFASNGDMRAAVARLSIHAVPSPPDGPKGSGE